MTTLSATTARVRWFSLLKDLRNSHRIYQITSRDSQAVLLSKEDYEGLLETLELLSIPGMTKSIKQAKNEIKEGKTRSMKEVLGD